MQSRLRPVAYTVLCLAMIASIAAPGEYQLRKGKPISQIRAQLLNNGWLPVRIDKQILEGGGGNQHGDGRLMFSAGYIEVESCTGADVELCVFNYQKNGRCLRLTTVGEYHAPLGEPLLDSWSTDCPDPNSKPD